MTKPLLGSNVRICSTPDCGRRHYAKDLCFRCYSRERYRTSFPVSRRGRRSNKLSDGGQLFIQWRDSAHIPNGAARGRWMAFQRDSNFENTPGKCTVAEFERFIAWFINKGSSREYACLVCGANFGSSGSQTVLRCMPQGATDSACPALSKCPSGKEAR